MPKLITPGQWVQIDWTCDKCAVPMLPTGTVFTGGLHEHKCPKCRRKVNLLHAHPYHEFIPDARAINVHFAAREGRHYLFEAAERDAVWAAMAAGKFQNWNSLYRYGLNPNSPPDTVATSVRNALARYRECYPKWRPKIKQRFTFLGMYHACRVSEEAIDDYIDRWHEGGSDQPLHEYLGLTRQEYEEWVVTDKLPPRQKP